LVVERDRPKSTIGSRAFQVEVAEQTRCGITLPLSGSFGGIEVAYLSGLPGDNNDSSTGESRWLKPSR
jgi:hypothetical protein